MSGVWVAGDNVTPAAGDSAPAHLRSPRGHGGWNERADSHRGWVTWLELSRAGRIRELDCDGILLLPSRSGRQKLTTRKNTWTPLEGIGTYRVMKLPVPALV